MGDGQRRLKDKASQAYADGRLKDALKHYVRVVEEDPSELQCQLKVGDIHKRLGNRDAAVEAYAPVARAYADDGLLLKAIAVCKMILSVDSGHADTQALLADLSQARRGPPKAPFHRAAPVTLQGMGISMPAASPAIPEYGMVELEASGASAAAHPVQWPGAVRVVDADHFGDGPTLELDDGTGPRTVTGRPDTPPPGAPASPWRVGVPNPAPRPSWPATTPPPELVWPGASTPGAVAWPTAQPTEAPKIVVGSRLEDSALHIEVDEPLELDMGGDSPPSEEEKEALADQAALEVEAAMAELTAGAAEEAEAGAMLDLEGDVDLAAAVAEAAASVGADEAPEESMDLEVELDDGFVEHEVPDAPIELTDVVSSADLAPPIALSAVSEDIRADVLVSEDSLEDIGRPQIPLFSDLPKNAFIELLVHMEMHNLVPGDVVIREGDVGDSFFVLVSGQVRVSRRSDAGEELVLAYLTEGAFFGEMALLQDGARTATVQAQSDCQLFEIKKEVLDQVVSHYPSVAAVLRNFYRQRLLSTTMATHPLFRPFTPDERRAIMELFKSKSFKKGDVLVEEGKKGTGLFLLLYGTLEVVKDRDGAHPKVLAELSSGDLFGEMSLLTGKPTMATVRAITDCFVLRLAKRNFDELIMTHPQILELVSVLSDERQGINELLLAQGAGGATGAVLV
ncbi:MAG: cyclic nucleotide-binding domain-containing protein [Myxococcales bacterium]|nr:cyclic nucleotide-binding domain-containing protein [Myxococcales bacterium]